MPDYDCRISKYYRCCRCQRQNSKASAIKIRIGKFNRTNLLTFHGEPTHTRYTHEQKMYYAIVDSDVSLAACDNKNTGILRSPLNRCVSSDCGGRTSDRERETERSRTSIDAILFTYGKKNDGNTQILVSTESERDQMLSKSFFIFCAVYVARLARTRDCIGLALAFSPARLESRERHSRARDCLCLCACVCVCVCMRTRDGVTASSIYKCVSSLASHTVLNMAAHLAESA